MKKAIFILLAMLLLVSMTACGATGNSTNNDDPGKTPAADSQPAADITDKDDDDALQISFKPREFNKGATIEETVLVDEDNVKITATELTYGNYAAELTLVIENNSDKDLSFIANSVGYSCNSVNGYMVPEGYLNCDVAAGKKANDSISISYDSLMLYGIFEIADIEIDFDISDDDYNHTYTGPRIILTSAADGYDYETPVYRENIASQESQTEYDYSVPYFSTDTVYEESGLVIASQAVMENQDGESILLLEVVNNSDAVVGISTTNIDINGLRVCDSTWSYDTVNPGKTAIVNIDLSSVLEPEYWDIYGIQEVGNVALKVSFKDDDSKEITEPALLSIDIPGADASFSMDGTEVYNGNGIRLVSKGVFADPSEYSDDLHILMVAENTSGRTLALHDVYDSLSVNDYMTTYSFYTKTIEDGTSVMIDIRLWGYGLGNISITGASQIQSVEFSMSIKDQNYKEIDKVTVAFTIE